MHQTSPCIHNECLQVGIQKLESIKLKTCIFPLWLYPKELTFHTLIGICYTLTAMCSLNNP